MKSLESQREIIEDILRSDERARNDDKWLTYKFFSYYTKIYIPFEDFKRIPAFANAQKIRQKIQNKEGKYLPTDAAVRLKRGIAEDKFREWMRHG